MKILLIDGTNNFIRNYAAVPTLTANGEPNGGVYGMLNSLGYFVRITQPDRVIIAWDGAGGSKKRRAVVKEYKKGRKPIRLNRNFEFETVNEEKNKVWQRVRVGQYLSDLPVTQITVDEIEADDIIAYLTRFYEKEKKIIASNDKDFYQLLSENTVIFSPRNKSFINNKQILESFSIHPRNFALARAIAGDPGDNLAGIKSVGMKNVVKFFPMLSEEKKLELNSLFEFADKKGEKYKKFLENKDIIINNLKVMRLDDAIIGNASIKKIHDSLEKPLTLNGTSFRIKLLEDGINSITEHYLQAFRVLEGKGK